MNSGFHAAVIAAMLGGISALVVLVFAIRGKSRGPRVLFGLLAAILLLPSAFVLAALNPWLVDARFRTYRSFHREIEIGMTRPQVMALVRRHYPAGGPRGMPEVMDNSAERLGFFMNPEHGSEPNCEGIFLKMNDDRVTAIVYSAD